MEILKNKQKLYIDTLIGKLNIDQESTEAVREACEDSFKVCKFEDLILIQTTNIQTKPVTIRKKTPKNLYVSIYSKLCKNFNRDFNLGDSSKHYETLPESIKTYIVTRTDEYNTYFISNGENPNLKEEIVTSVLNMLLSNNIQLAEDVYKRNYASYRKIRSLMKEKLINDITEKINIYWNIIKVDKKLMDSFFDKYEYLYKDKDNVKINSSNNVNLQIQPINNPTNNFEDNFDI